MAQITSGIRGILSNPSAYDFLQSILGAGRARKLLVRDHIRPTSSDYLLDIGCGTGELLNYLPANVRYIGFDLSPDYINAARERYGHRGRFECADVADFEPADLRGVDLVLAIGVLHHLDNDQVKCLFQTAWNKLRPGGRFISLDGTLVNGQSRIARALILRDRGQNIRSPDGYQALATSKFSTVTCTVRHDLLHVPYTHCILECTR
ncbi:MAG: class I SAM-dependent methyltransferase [Terriglobales bacterium]